MDADANEPLLRWDSISRFLSLSSDLREFLARPGRAMLQRYSKGSVSIPKLWTVDEMFFYLEAWNGGGGYLGLGLDPLGTYLRDASPCVWVIAGIWHFEALKKHVEDQRTFGSHIYFAWNTADDKWSHEMHPVGRL